MNANKVRGCVAALLLGVGVSGSALAADQRVLAEVEKERSASIALADDIWAFAELGYLETKSSERLQGYLSESGFAVRVGSPTYPPPSWRLTAKGSR